MFTQKFIKIFHSVQEMGLFSLFQNLNLGNASANPKWHLTISWVTSYQYQCICKILSKYSKRFKSYWHFSRTGRRQNLHKLSGDKIKCLIIGHSMKFNFQVSDDFLRVVQFTFSRSQIMYILDCRQILRTVLYSCILNCQAVIYRFENGFQWPLLPYAWWVLSEGIKVAQLHGIEVINWPRKSH